MQRKRLTDMFEMLHGVSETGRSIKHGTLCVLHVFIYFMERQSIMVNDC